MICRLARIGVVFAALANMAPPALADDLIGQASVIDGDTLEIHGTRIRLWGLDAPESSQLCRGEDSLPYRCGAKSANALDSFIARRPVNCLPITLDQYGRTVATCSVGGVDIGDWLVRGVLLWIGHSTPRERTTKRSETLSMTGAKYGPGVTSNHGHIEYVFARTALRSIAQMMPALTLNAAKLVCRRPRMWTGVSCTSQRPFSEVSSNDITG
jgi:nuclease-like protein